MERERLIHPIPPTYDANSEILILGSFPSPKSRESGYYYGHPQNRFWRVVAAIYEEDVPATVAEKRAFLLRNHIAAWDVIQSCNITGASDSSISDVIVNDITPILRTANIRAIYVNGKIAYKHYQKYMEAETDIKATCLPSTSPANAAWSLARLTEAWRQIKSDNTGGHSHGTI